MNSSRLSLVELTVAGTEVPDASVRFAPGLNLIVGASDTGKTFIFEAIDFMLGASQGLRRIPEGTGYDRVFLSIDPTERPQFTLRRGFDGGQFEATEYQNGRSNPPTATKTLKAAHSPDPDDSLSSYLLRAIGMRGVEVRRNARGEKRALSFRDVCHLTLISEQRVIQQSSPVVTGQLILKTAERSVFAYFLTGQDDSQVIPHESREDRNIRLNAEAAVIESMLDEQRGELAKISEHPDQLPAQIERLERAIEKAGEAVVTTQDQIREVAETREGLFEQITKIRSRLVFLEEQLKRLRLLEAFYESDRARLLGVIEASKVVHEMPVGTCPLCSQPLSGSAGEGGSHQAFEQACQREIEKIDGLSRDLRAAVADFTAETQDVRVTSSRLSGELRDIDHHLQRVLTPGLGTARQHLQELIQGRANVAKGETIRTMIRGLEERLARVEAGRRERQPRTAFEARATTGSATAFCKVVEDILRAWKYPNLGEVAFDTDKADLVIGGQDRTNKGKGYRAITYAAFSIGLMRYCRQNGIPHPGIVVIDTPLNPFRGPDVGADEEAVEDEVKVAFYEHLAADNSGDQVIIMENEAPPEAVRARVNYCHFTKNPSFGRYGFFPYRPQVTGGAGMAAGTGDRIYTSPTQRRQLRYLFTAEHHGGGGCDAMRWSPHVSTEEEFSIFDFADLHDVSDDQEWLYGALRASDGGLRYLGTCNQQLAEFPAAREGQAWYGYPLWPLKALGPENRRGERARQAKDVFRKMEQAGLITERERRRLDKGDHV